MDDEQRAAVTATEAEAFVRAVAEARGRWLSERGSGPMRFYCWHDDQAGQLRLSLVSVGGGPLPFGCPVEQVSVLGAVIRAFLEPAARRPSAPLLVWIAVVPPVAKAEPPS